MYGYLYFHHYINQFPSEKLNLIKRIGPTKGGHWEIIQNKHETPTTNNPPN